MYTSAESVTADPSLQLAQAVCRTPTDKDRQTCKQKGGTLGRLELVQPVIDVNPSAATTSDTDRMATSGGWKMLVSSIAVHHKHFCMVLSSNDGM
jgi:hypothetical protein